MPTFTRSGHARTRPRPSVARRQLAAVQEGLRNVGKQVMRNYLENCATHAIRERGGPEIYDELMEIIYKYVR